MKITTNFDRLIETYAPHGVYVNVAYGYESEKLDWLFTLRQEEDNALLKIHGGIGERVPAVL